MPCNSNDRTCGQQELGNRCDNKPAHSSYLIQTFLAKCKIILVHQAFYFPNKAHYGCSLSWKGAELNHVKTVQEMWWHCCISFPKRSSRNASNNCEAIGRSLCSPKKNTLKGIRVSDLRTFDEPSVSWLTRIFTAAWKEKKIPKDWQKGKLVSTWRNTKNKSRCATYKGITLLSYIGKM